MAIPNFLFAFASFFQFNIRKLGWISRYIPYLWVIRKYLPCLSADLLDEKFLLSGYLWTFATTGSVLQKNEEMKINKWIFYENMINCLSILPSAHTDC